MTTIAYFAGCAASLLFFGRLSNRFGRRLMAALAALLVLAVLMATRLLNARSLMLNNRLTLLRLTLKMLWLDLKHRTLLPQKLHVTSLM